MDHYQLQDLLEVFVPATAEPAGTAESAYWLWEFCLSVCPSVTTRYGFKAR